MKERDTPYEVTVQGDRLFRARRMLGLSQENFAKHCGFSRNRYLSMENGRNQITSHQAIVGLARGFGVSTGVVHSYLFTGRPTLAEFLSQSAPPKPMKPGRIGHQKGQKNVVD